MGKGTPSMGKRSSKKTHIICRRCGKRTYKVPQQVCSSCGYGKSAKLRSYTWAKNK